MIGRRPPRRPVALRLGLLLAGLLVGLAAACGGRDATAKATSDAATTAAPGDETAPVEGEAAVIELVTMDDPRSIGNAHQGYVDGPPDVGRLPRFAETVVRGQLLAIGPTRLATPTGRWEDHDDPELLIAQRAAAAVRTELHVRVHEVLGQRSGLTEPIAVGETIVPIIAGGEFAFDVTPAQAEATGLRPDVSHEQEQADTDAGREPDGPGPVPDRPFSMSISSDYSVDLTEGDEVVVFLSRPHEYDQLANDGSVLDSRILYPINPLGAGLFTSTTDGRFRHAANPDIVDIARLTELADEVSALSGEADVPTAGELYGP